MLLQRGVVVLLLCLRAAASGSSGKFNATEAWKARLLASVSTRANKCAEPAVRGICNCDKESLTKGNQCSACIENKDWWGYGCDLPCPQGDVPGACLRGCDFKGDCIVPPHCKRNGRVDNTSPKWQVLNERGECQACQDDDDKGYCGLWCEKDCPTNCAQASTEGFCSRGGNCYECKKGFYGQTCNMSCPQGCDECIMLDNLVNMAKPNEAEFLPAGACPQDKKCPTNSWGVKCEKDCPANCKDSRTPSCLRDTGKCLKCQGHLWYGDNCDSKCSVGCMGGTCAKATGECESGCVKGWWGAKCSQKCPEGTVESAGCERDNGLPFECNEGSYPDTDMKLDQGKCTPCPDNCAGGQCNSQGKCINGCESGFYGSECDIPCAPHCNGPCDKKHNWKSKDGQCQACDKTWTGALCMSKCDSTCSECGQDEAEDCVTCPDDEPSELKHKTGLYGKVGTCVCIRGAERDKQTGRCKCIEPEDKDMEAFFESRPTKLCREKCLSGLKEVFSMEDKQRMCLKSEVYRSVIVEESNKGGMQYMQKGNCADGELSIPTSDGEKCLKKGFVQFITEGV